MFRFPITQGSASSQSSRTGKSPTPSRALFNDLSSAYSSIAARSASAQLGRGAETSPGPTLLDEYRRNEAPLPPIPAVTRHVSQIVGPVQGVQADSGYNRPVIRMPTRPPFWKQKLSSVFHRNADNRSLSTLLPTVEVRTIDGVSRDRDTSDLTSNDLNQFVNIDAASQSAPALGEASRQSMSTGRTSSHYGDSLIHHTRVSGSQYALSIHEGAGAPYHHVNDPAMDYSLDGPYSQPQTGGKLEGDLQGWTDEQPLSTSDAKDLPRKSTVKSLVGSYGADCGASKGSMYFEDVEADGMKAQFSATKAGASQEASPISRLESQVTNLYSTTIGDGFGTLAGSVTDNTAMAHTSSPRRHNPPNGPLPTRPNAVAMPLSLGQTRDGSTLTNGISQASSYGDTRDLLNISTALPSLQSRQQTSSGLGKEARSPFPRAFSAKSSKLNDDDGLQNSSSGLEQYPSSSAEPRARSELMNGSGKVVLDRQISRELRRISHLSGLSNLSGSIVVLDEELSRSGSVHDKNQTDFGPGGSQSSSSQEISQVRTFNSGSLSDARSPGASLYRFNLPPRIGRHGTIADQLTATSQGSFASSMPLTETSASVKDLAQIEEYHGDEDFDWVTEADSRAFSKYETENELPLGMTGSSLADYSSNGSLISHSRQASQLSPVRETLRHPADERYEHVYRVRRLSETGQPLLLPEYSYGSGNGFPNRNALTTPISATSSINNSYQHPTPLTKQHAHPFTSSPPPLSSEKKFSYSRNANRKAADLASQGDEETEFEDKHSADSGIAGSTPDMSEESFVESLGRYGPDRNQIVSFASSLGLGRGVDNFRPSSTWVTTNGDESADLGPLNALAGSNGSFFKITTLGPRGNITGSPEGTGMRQVGSSLADASSPGMIWSSSPPQLTSSPAVITYGPTGGDTHDKENFERSAEDSIDSHVQCKLGDMCEAVCGHGQHSRTNAVVESPPMNPESAHMGLVTLAPSSPHDSGWFFGNSVAADASTLSYNHTPPLPHLERMKVHTVVSFTAHLQRLPRPASSVATVSRQRKKNLSRVMLLVCLLFPPLLIIYGYGYMDHIIVQITDGQIEHFGRNEKRLALWLGWSLAASAVAGLTIGMVVIAVI